MKLDSDRRNETEYFTNKIIGKIEAAFSSLPKSINWQSFYLNDLKPYLKMDDEVKKVSAEKKLRKSQAKALQKVKEEAPHKPEHFLDVAEAYKRLNEKRRSNVWIAEQYYGDRKREDRVRQLLKIADVPCIAKAIVRGKISEEDLQILPNFTGRIYRG